MFSLLVGFFCKSDNKQTVRAEINLTVFIQHSLLVAFEAGSFASNFTSNPESSMSETETRLSQNQHCLAETDLQYYNTSHFVKQYKVYESHLTNMSMLYLSTSIKPFLYQPVQYGPLKICFTVSCLITFQKQYRFPWQANVNRSLVFVDSVISIKYN